MQNVIVPFFDPGSIDDAAGQLLASFPETRIFAFYGEMGAGKTTFIKAVCRHFGVDHFVTSPTFALVNEYRNNEEGKSIFHFDFFRIETVEEVLDMGYEDYFYSGSICFIEWPEKISGLLPAGTLRLSIDVLDDGKRRLRKLPDE